MRTNNLAIGEFSVIELLKHHQEAVLKIYVKNNKEKEKYIKYFANVKVDKDYINKIIKKEDIYALAVFRPYKMKLNNDLHLLINNLKDEGEIGTIIRTAVCFDIKNIVLINCVDDIFNEKITRASAGAFFIANIVNFKDKNNYLLNYPNNKTIEFINDKFPLSLEVGKQLYKFKQHQCDNR